MTRNPKVDKSNLIEKFSKFMGLVAKESNGNPADITRHGQEKESADISLDAFRDRSSKASIQLYNDIRANEYIYGMKKDQSIGQIRAIITQRNLSNPPLLTQGRPFRLAFR